MLLILMYHQIIDSKEEFSLTANKFEQHLKYLQQNFHIVVPGQKLLKNKLSVCLTFDDAYADFYHFIYPILKKLHIPSILGIPSGLVQDNSSADLRDRLQAICPINEHFAKDSPTPLCTWQEIKAMVNSGFIHPASHSHTHQNLSKTSLGVAYEELCVSKRKILAKLGKIAETFIYPFGAQNQQVQLVANNHYQYVMRIGNAINKDWQQKILYRIDGDQFWRKNKKVSMFNLWSWKLKYWWNYVRRK